MLNTEKDTIDYVSAAEALLVGAEKILDKNHGLCGKEEINLASRAILEASLIADKIGSRSSYIVEVGFKRSLNNLLEAMERARLLAKTKD